MPELHHKNIFVSQLELLRSSSSASTYDLAIVGSGISCAYTLIHYIFLLKEKLRVEKKLPFKAIKIAVLDKSAEFWTGIPYGNRSGEQSLTITSLREFLPKPERDRFSDWLRINHQAVFSSLKRRSGILNNQWLKSYQEAIEQNTWDELFIPRYLFGWYLKERVASLLEEASEQNYLQYKLIVADVCNIKKLPEAYQIDTTNHASLLASKVVLAIGSPPNKTAFLDQLDDSERSLTETQAVSSLSEAAREGIYAEGDAPRGANPLEYPYSKSGKGLAARRPLRNSAIPFEVSNTLERSAAKDICYIANMYEPSQNSNLERILESLQGASSELKQVLIIGSNASALETIYSLNNLSEIAELVDKFVVISPSGEFPHRITSNPISTDYVAQNLESLVRQENFTAKQIYEAVQQDVLIAFSQKETIDSTYSTISSGVIKALNQLSYEEQKQFVTKYGMKIGKFQRRAGVDYLNVVERLVLQRKMEFIRGKFAGIVPLANDKHSFKFVTGDRIQAQQYPSPIQVMINCTGFQDLTKSSSTLINSLINQGICIPNDSLYGFEMNENFEADENFYLMGPLVAGNVNHKLKVWHAESCSRIFHLSQDLAQNLLQ